MSRNRKKYKCIFCKRTFTRSADENKSQPFFSVCNMCKTKAFGKVVMIAGKTMTTVGHMIVDVTNTFTTEKKKNYKNKKSG